LAFGSEVRGHEEPDLLAAEDEFVAVIDCSPRR